MKEAQVSAGDPFCNFDGQFYRSQMLARNAQNSVFPCGSGLVWRREALEEIGGFPTWNLVEDFQSGVDALRGGWRGCYLPIVGAVGQHSPEDVPNVIKQRGTWAIDTVRLIMWGNLRGLNLRQRLAFTEMMFFYLHSFTVLVYVPATALACMSIVPVTAPALSCLIHLMPYALAAELRLLLLNQPFGDRRRRQRHPLRSLWRVKVMWMGLAPIYIVGCCQGNLRRVEAQARIQGHAEDHRGGVVLAGDAAQRAAGGARPDRVLDRSAGPPAAAPGDPDLGWVLGSDRWGRPGRLLSARLARPHPEALLPERVPTPARSPPDRADARTPRLTAALAGRYSLSGMSPRLDLRLLLLPLRGE